MSVAARVVEKTDSVLQPLRYGKTMTRTTSVKADSTEAIEITIWGPIDQINVGSGYEFKNYTLKVLDEKKLSTKKDSAIKRIEDLNNICKAPLSKPKDEVIEIMGIKIDTTTKCVFCSSTLVINETINSVKCMTCYKRQLNKNVSTCTRCEITGETQDKDVATYNVPPEVLENFCSPDITNDDKEIFILACTKLQITTNANNTITQLKMVR